MKSYSYKGYIKKKIKNNQKEDNNILTKEQSYAEGEIILILK